MADEVTTTTTSVSTGDEGDGGAGAAVTGALAGAAAVEAGEARREAAEAGAMAGAGAAEAAEARAEAQAAELRAMSVDEKLDRLVTLQLSQKMAEVEQPPVPKPVEVAGPPPEQAPKSIGRKARERKTFRQRWGG